MKSNETKEEKRQDSRGEGGREEGKGDPVFTQVQSTPLLSDVRIQTVSLIIYIFEQISIAGSQVWRRQGWPSH